ncbi:type IV pili twitching motility protein PilT [Candidatus Campbellbacteria bacterium CG22_combo_CG10-13_8_21_14_all_43_18]|uniref:Type IV pili twitching motility protein PilT n=1 Tax=Candidatus Campbellbacteria bacterium CG22_combo_CG10-13_8_21_14_all_43_18 TaxID=1974530 RepID=A0A2H0DWZ7_9BACT|nr:MAG: type IV pili twitching motility protein PilT [Candidatus Campbellbacteria bacterium CG22_combo_CG10-13_8_21_14_all_43_18]
MTNSQETLERLIAVLITDNASDLHLSVGRYPTVRVSGDLIPLQKEKVLTEEDTLGFLSALLPEDKKKAFLQKKDIDFSYSFKKEARLRGNAFYQKDAISIALRLIPRVVGTFQDLHLPSILENFAGRKQGFFLVVGPVGQGKSTTLASMIEFINTTRTEHILTIEDPIEYFFDQKKSIIDQREVGLDTESFDQALNRMFRQDINVGMIGEMRDPDTIATAVTAAETGHLILSTLHTNNASQTIDRIIDSFSGPEQAQIRSQLAASLTGIFSQRLVKRVSGGRIPAYELLINNKAVSNLIREGRTHEVDSIIEISSDIGMISMERSLANLAREGEVSLDEARLHSLNPALLEKLM